MGWTLRSGNLLPLGRGAVKTLLLHASWPAAPHVAGITELDGAPAWSPDRLPLTAVRAGTGSARGCAGRPEPHRSLVLTPRGCDSPRQRHVRHDERAMPASGSHPRRSAGIPPFVFSRGSRQHSGRPMPAALQGAHACLAACAWCACTASLDAVYRAISAILVRLLL